MKVIGFLQVRKRPYDRALNWMVYGFIQTYYMLNIAVHNNLLEVVRINGHPNNGRLPLDEIT